MCAQNCGQIQNSRGLKFGKIMVRNCPSLPAAPLQIVEECNEGTLRRGATATTECGLERFHRGPLGLSDKPLNLAAGRTE
jgi:hypothetical protein